MKKTILPIVFAATCTAGHTAVITGVTATADSSFASAPVSTLVDNSGLSVADSFTATHSSDQNGVGQWITDIGVTGNTNVTFDLGGSYDLTDVYIWNNN